MNGFAQIQQFPAHATLRVPLFGTDVRPSAVLLATYRRADPLAVNLEIRTPEEATVFRRIVLRSDLIAGLTRVVDLGGTRIAPGDADMIEITFADSGANVALRIPGEAARRFVHLTQRIVSLDEEGAVLGELAAGLSQKLG